MKFWALILYAALAASILSKYKKLAPKYLAARDPMKIFPKFVICPKDVYEFAATMPAGYPIALDGALKHIVELCRDREE